MSVDSVYHRDTKLALIGLVELNTKPLHAGTESGRAEDRSKFVFGSIHFRPLQVGQGFDG